MALAHMCFNETEITAYTYSDLSILIEKHPSISLYLKGVNGYYIKDIKYILVDYKSLAPILDIELEAYLSALVNLEIIGEIDIRVIKETQWMAYIFKTLTTDDMVVKILYLTPIPKTINFDVSNGVIRPMFTVQ